MDKSINSLFKMSFTLRNFAVLHRHLTIRLLRDSKCHLLNREITSASISKHLSDNPSMIFDYIKRNRDHLTVHNCLEALQKLSKFYLKSRTQLGKLEDNKDLLVLCNEIDRRTKIFDLSQTIEVMELLLELGIPSKSIIFHSLMRNINKDAHSLTDKHIIALKRVMKKTEASNLKKAVNHALLEVSRSDTAGTNLNLISMCSNLYKASNANTPRNELITSILIDIDKYPNEIPLLTAKSIFVSCTKFPYIINHSFGKLFKRIQDSLILQASNLTYKSILEILEALTEALYKDHLSEKLYDEHFIDSLIKPLLTNNKLCLKEGIDILQHLKALGHFQKPFIDYIALMCFENPSLIAQMEKLELIHFVAGFIVSDYIPPFWESIQQLIIENKNFKALTDYSLIRITCDLAIMNSFQNHLISSIFQLNESAFIKTRFKTKKRFALLYQIVKTLDTNYVGPWPSQSILNIVFNSISHRSFRYKTFPFLSTLEKALGGSQYVKTNVQTKLGHFIDHVLVMRRGGFPIAINLSGDETNLKPEDESVSYVEDIVVPSESQIILILSMDPSAYLRNIKQPKGYFHAYIKSLEALKYTVVPILMSEWMEINDRDKILFIMNLIRLKISVDTVEMNV